jgi:molecular chaperone DnaJ
MINVVTCSNCHGEGRIIVDPCPECNGQGKVIGNKNIEINIPAGVASGNYIPLRGEGNAGTRNGTAGDLIVYIEEEKHPVFERADNDVVMVLPVSFPQAALGASLDIPTLTGAARITIPAGTQSGKILRMRNKGIPNLHGAGIGDQLVQIHVYIPTHLSAEEKRRIKDLEHLENLKPPKDHDKNIFEKFKEALNL